MENHKMLHCSGFIYLYNTIVAENNTKATIHTVRQVRSSLQFSHMSFSQNNMYSKIISLFSVPTMST